MHLNSPYKRTYSLLQEGNEILIHMARIVDLQAEHSITQSRIGMLHGGIENRIPVDPIIPLKINSVSIVTNLLNGFTYVPNEKISENDVNTLSTLMNGLIEENKINRGISME